MMSAFTWRDFLIAAGVFSLLWLVVAGLLLYRKELFERWSGRSLEGRGSDPEPGREPLGHGWAGGVDELADDDGEPADLMGKPQSEEGVSVVSAGDFTFARPGLDKSEALGAVPDMQEEIKSICRVLEKEDGGKEHFFSLFGLVKQKYPGVARSAALPGLNEFIREHVPFFLSDEELDSLWL